ncbi:tyrosine-type recombinase/integrase [Edwardsiella piscicida]|uniref:tyrosine-type recombinase/integrase n=1 Tax=Edwardsiella piscicida TaxID=1263550 RepID=UPI00290CB4F9|nr:tyrosine-type recombinase/integrase [Edwardsiella piscicida]
MVQNNDDNATPKLPDNLYCKGGFFIWRNPLSGQEMPLGYIKKNEAVRQAQEANQYIDTQRPMEEACPSVSQWMAEYLRILGYRGVAANTLRARRSQIKAVQTVIGQKNIAQVTTRDIALLLHHYVLIGHLSAAGLMRSFLNALFREAIAAGLIDYNPVTQTRTPPIRVKRRRLTETMLQTVYAQALQLESHKPWLPRSIELALLTGQRREDLCALRWQDIREDKLWVIQRKTGARLAMTLDLHLQLGDYPLRLREVLARCRLPGPSDYLLNSQRSRLNRRPGGALVPDTLTKGFSRLMDKCGLVQEIYPPSFHEIRSLSSRMYQAQYGTEFCQRLLGHKNRHMTEKYLDLREALWQVIEIPKNQ